MFLKFRHIKNHWKTTAENDWEGLCPNTVRAKLVKYGSYLNVFKFQCRLKPVFFTGEIVLLAFSRLSMAQNEGDEFLLSGEATGGGESDEEIEVTAAEVLAQLEEVNVISL